MAWQGSSSTCLKCILEGVYAGSQTSHLDEVFVLCQTSAEGSMQSWSPSAVTPSNGYRQQCLMIVPATLPMQRGKGLGRRSSKEQAVLVFLMVLSSRRAVVQVPEEIKQAAT